MVLKQRTPLAVVLKANLRRQAGPLVALTVAAGVAWFFLDPMVRSGAGWIVAGEEGGTAARAIGGAAAGFLAGWQGGAEERHDARWMRQTSVRAPVSPVLLGLASGVVWPLAGYLLAVTAVLAWPGSWDTATRPPLDAMAVDAALIVAVSCVAHLLGRTIPLRVTPLVVGAAALLLGPVWQLLFPLEHTYTGTGAPVPQEAARWVLRTPPAWVPWCRAVLIAAVAAAAVLLCAYRWRPAVALLLATAALGLGVTWAGGTAASAFNPTGIRCTGRAPAVCVSAEHEAQRQRLEREVTGLSRLLEGVREAPTHYVWTQKTEVLGGCGGSGGVGSPWVVAVPWWSPAFDDLARSVAEDRCGELRSPQARALYAWLTGWDELGAQERLLLRRLDGLPARERAAWIDRYLTAVKRGRPLPSVPEPNGR
ncbi:hypothetical protein [Streptomyces sp. NPDC093094]|uniref:hypothetical protein n=1 Tax=Streptomyces sp. NPDC093094 TaxID=3366026 RepID=UPI0037F74E1B